MLTYKLIFNLIVEEYLLDIYSCCYTEHNYI